VYTCRVFFDLYSYITTNQSHNFWVVPQHIVFYNGTKIALDKVFFFDQPINSIVPILHYVTIKKNNLDLPSIVL
jgi:hypothetical protein